MELLNSRRLGLKQLVLNFKPHFQRKSQRIQVALQPIHRYLIRPAVILSKVQCQLGEMVECGKLVGFGLKRFEKTEVAK